MQEVKTLKGNIMKVEHLYYEVYLYSGEKSNDNVISLVTNSLIPALNSLAAFIAKRKSEVENYPETRKVIHEILGKCFDIETQAKWTNHYGKFNRAELINKIEKHGAECEAGAATFSDEDWSGVDENANHPYWQISDKYERATDNACLESNPKINDAKQSNYRVMVMLTDDAKKSNHEYAHSINRNIPVLKVLIKKLFADLFDDPTKDIKAYKYLRDLIERIGDLALEITTHVNYTSRCLNGLLNPNASVYTKQIREPQSWGIEQKA